MIDIRASVARQPFAREDGVRESRLELALLRGVLENLKPNRLMMPIFAAAVCAMFSPWVPAGTLALWYGIVLASPHGSNGTRAGWCPFQVDREAQGNVARASCPCLRGEHGQDARATEGVQLAGGTTSGRS